MKNRQERLFMILWGLTLFSIGLATFLMFYVVEKLSANHALLIHISGMHLGGGS